MEAFVGERGSCHPGGCPGGWHRSQRYRYPADFIYDNLAMECNVIRAAQRAGVGKLLFLGSSCIYPRLAPQPIPEEALLQGDLEATNEPYAVAKIAGIKLCESCNRQYGTDYRSVMPTNLYGPGDNFHPENAQRDPRPDAALPRSEGAGSSPGGGLGLGRAPP